MRHILRFTIIFLLFGFLVLAVSCSTVNAVWVYSGEEREANEIAILYLPEAMDMVSIDGKKMDRPFVRTGGVEYHFLPGTHEIRIIYIKYWDINTEEFETLVSDIVVLRQNMQSGHTYRVEYESPNSLESARAFASNMNAWIREIETGKKVEFQSTKEVFTTLYKDSDKLTDDNAPKPTKDWMIIDK